MQIKLKSLMLKNFKGIKEKEIIFSDDTEIRGQNATGKTSIFDAYSWLLWDKDSTNKKQFGIKPWQLNGEETHNIESTVEGVLLVDGKELKLTKTYREIWTKKRGRITETFTGNTTDYFINDVPLKKSDYEKRISSLVDENQFNLLSNPLYFNMIIDNKARRKILVSLIEDITNEDVFNKNKELKALDLEHYSIDELKAMAKAGIKKINQEIEDIPVRIDELSDMKVDYNFKELEEEKKALEKELKSLEISFNDTSELIDYVKNKNAEISQLEIKKRSIKNKFDEEQDKLRKKATNKVFEKKQEKSKKVFEFREQKLKFERAIKSYNSSVDAINSDIENDKDKVDFLRKQWAEKNSEIFTGSLSCPVCGQDYPLDKKQEILENFNKDKSKTLENITNKATLYIQEINQLEEKKKEHIEQEKVNKANLEELEKEIERINNLKIEDIEYEEVEFENSESYKEYQKIDEQIKKIEIELDGFDKKDNSELKKEIEEVNTKLDDIKVKLDKKNLNKEIDKKIENYEKEEKELAIKFEEQQEILSLIEEYTKTYVDLVSDLINKKFEIVKFKLFDIQVNGGIKETAEATVNGVPFSDLNNATKINVGLDIINTLSKHYELNVPIFVDNAESVNHLFEVDSQIVKLVVTEDKELIIK